MRHTILILYNVCNHVRCAPEPSDTVNPFGETLKTRPTGSRAHRQRCIILCRATGGGRSTLPQQQPPSRPANVPNIPTNDYMNDR